MGDEGRLRDEGEGRMVEFGLRDSPKEGEGQQKRSR